MSLSKHCSQTSMKPPNRVGIDISFLIIGKEDMTMDVKKSVEMISILRFKKGDNEIEIKGHLSNEEKIQITKTLLKDGWGPSEKIN